MENGKRSNKTIWIVLGLVAALLFGCMMGGLAGGLAGFAIGRHVARISGSASVPMKVVVAKRSATENPPVVQAGAILVTQVVNASPAEKAGLVTGDIITALDGQKLTPSDSLGNRLLAYKPGDTVQVSVVRASRQLEFSVVLGVSPVQDTRAWLGIYYQQAPMMSLPVEPD